jgi:hypothetical protein
MELTVEVIGMKAFKGNVNGNNVDSGTLYAVVKLDERYNKEEAGSHNHKCGNAIEEWKLPSAEHVFRMKHLKPSMSNPIMVKLEIERVSNGKESAEMVIDCRPVEPAVQQVREPAQVRKVA